MRRLTIRARVVGVARVLARVLARVAGRPVVWVARRVVAGRAGGRGVGVGRRVGAIRRGRGVMRRRRAIGAAIRASAEGRRAHENLRAYAVCMPCASRVQAVCKPCACQAGAPSHAPSMRYGLHHVLSLGTRAVGHLGVAHARAHLQCTCSAVCNVYAHPPPVRLKFGLG